MSCNYQPTLTFKRMPENLAVLKNDGILQATTTKPFKIASVVWGKSMNVENFSVKSA